MSLAFRRLSDVGLVRLYKLEATVPKQARDDQRTLEGSLQGTLALREMELAHALDRENKVPALTLLCRAPTRKLPFLEYMPSNHAQLEIDLC